MSHDDILFEIMSRLPIKALLKFRSISKSWRDTIDSSVFRKLHFQNQLNKCSHNSNNINDDDIVFLQWRYKEPSLMSPDTGKWHKLFPSYKDFFVEYQDPEFSLPVHGLICLYDSCSNNPIALCNPSLGEIKILPPSPLPRHRSYRAVGLGYDDLEKDYKVVQILFQKNKVLVEIYSRKENKWRALAGYDKDYFTTEKILHMQPSWSGRSIAMAHWIVSNGNFEDVIVSFDMRSETFETIELPCVVCWWEYDVFVKDDSLFMIEKKNRERMTVWEYKADWVEVGSAFDETDRSTNYWSTVVVRDSDSDSREIIKLYNLPSYRVPACKGSFISP